MRLLAFIYEADAIWFEATEGEKEKEEQQLQHWQKQLVKRHLHFGVAAAEVILPAAAGPRK